MSVPLFTCVARAITPIVTFKPSPPLQRDQVTKMENLHRLLSRLSSPLSISLKKSAPLDLRFPSNGLKSATISIYRALSSKSNGGNDNNGAWTEGWDTVRSSKPEGDPASDPGWDSISSWSTGLTKDHFDGEAVGRQISPETAEVAASLSKLEIDEVEEMEKENRKSQAFVDGLEDRMRDLSVLMKQVREPGARGSYLKDSEKAEMYRKHKEDPETYTVEHLAKEYRIMRQRVHAILWLKELEEEEEKKLGRPLDDSVELLLDTCPEFFNSHDREFHVASLPYKPDFKVMPEGWDGTTRDPDEVHYEISMKEDEMLYQEFVQRMNFNKKKMAGEVKCHKYSRRRPSKGWNFTVEKLGPRGKRGGGGGWKFVSVPDGSSRALNETEKMYVRRETPRRRRKILP
ncbi:protein GAMETE CELL DEFECTIVE 1, mitochondrial [Magnolia sinica]|uniref:protein GAMETE CELL DEFECTIVE 1, mitochondrial n=1 Tax=Magnolia sinica TaxID=86752 RepID=UPI002658B01A|nr:protein GAMETE CELL DEFECTIVE 1, mitochondrial [Magnolia sinica]XP_058093591.1 protein GAMETE CELL DEFECTIVE 1, mitochondrial [Magnolia sinica]